MKRKLSVLLAAILFFTIVGCATTSTTLTSAQQYDLNFYKILAGAKASYDTAFTLLADLQKQGKLSDESAKKAIDAGNMFYLTYLVAVSTYEVYHRQVVATPGQVPTNQVTLERQLQDISSKLGAFLATLPKEGGTK